MSCAASTVGDPIGPTMAKILSRSTIFCDARTAFFGSYPLSSRINLILRPLMPPAALTSSTAIFMPLETGTPQTLIGPDKSWWVPITISVAEMPSLGTLVWAAAGRWVSASAPTARPSALNDFDILSLLFVWPVLSEGWGPLNPSPFPLRAALCHRPFAIHGLDLGRVTLVHEAALQLHGRRQLLILGRQLPLDQEEFLDGLDPREIDVDRLDLALDQILDRRGPAQARIIGEGNVVVLRKFLDILLVDHDEAGEIRPLVADHDRVRDIGREFQLVLDLRGRDVLAARGDDDVLHPVGDLHKTFVVDRADVAGVQPSPRIDGIRRFLRLVEIAHEQEIALDEDFAFRRNRHLAPRCGLADRAELDAFRRHHGGDAAVLGLAVDLAHVEAEREIPADQIRRDRRRTGESEAAAVEPEHAADVAEDQPVGDLVGGAQRQRRRLALEPVFGHAMADRQRLAVHPFLERRGVL